MSERLLIDERIRADSRVARTWVVASGDELGISTDIDGVGGVPVGVPAAVLVQVVTRYGRPLDEVAAGLDDAPRLDIGGQRTLVRLRWRAMVDATGRDWLVLLDPPQSPVAALATTVAAALRYLVDRSNRDSVP